jgi:hypothetical protein
VRREDYVAESVRFRFQNANLLETAAQLSRSTVQQTLPSPRSILQHHHDAVSGSTTRPESVALRDNLIRPVTIQIEQFDASVSSQPPHLFVRYILEHFRIVPVNGVLEASENKCEQLSPFLGR